MGRLPNHTFSIVKDRAITPVEANIESVKRYITRSFASSAATKSSEPLHNMGKSGKTRGSFGSDGTTSSDKHEGPSAHNSTNGSRGGAQNGNRRSSPQDDRSDGKSLDDHGKSDPNPDFSQYFKVVEEFTNQMAAMRKAVKNVQDCFARQQRDIRDAVDNRRQLDTMTGKYHQYKNAFNTLQHEVSERQEELAAEKVEVSEERHALAREKDAFVKQQEQLQEQFAEEKEKLNKRKSALEAEQNAKLNEQSKNLEKQQKDKLDKLEKQLRDKFQNMVNTQNEKYQQRCKSLETELKERQDVDRKRIAELEATNSQLMQDLNEDRVKLNDAKSELKDAKMLKSGYEKKAEELQKELNMAENEFGLNTKTAESYKESFLKIYSEVEHISSRYLRELPDVDLNALHSKIENLDKEFISVPISRSEPSATLRAAHAQRIISAQLQDIIWQPFSSETTLQDPKYASLFRQISDGLVRRYRGNCGLRAARLWKALTLRSLQYSELTSETSTPSPDRAQVFSDKVMTILSLLIKPSLHTSFRGSLLDLAKSAIDVWNIAQTDQCEVVVDLNIDLKSLDGWCEDIPEAQTGAIVLFPRITAVSYPRITGTRPAGPPGSWVDSDPEPEIHIEENHIYDGKGLGKWSPVIREGEEEEEERKEQEEEEKTEEMRRKLQEELQKFTKTGSGKRRLSNKVPLATEAEPKPSTVVATGGQKVNEQNG